MQKLEQIISSYKTTIVLLTVYAVGLAAATFIEKYYGTVAAKGMIYFSPGFFLLQFLMVVNFVAVFVRRQLLKQKKWGMLFVHFAFVVMLLGALVSHVFGEEGYLRLREGESSNRIEIRTSKGISYHTLPFEVELEDFILTRYPGSSSPSSYESVLVVRVDGDTRRERVYMNNVLDVKGYRFFQASFDPDEGGTVLSVNRDVAGRNITYTGYLILFVGLIFCLLGKNSRFMFLSRQLRKLRHTAVFVLLLLSLVGTVEAKVKIASPLLDAVQKYPVDEAHAFHFGSLPVQSSNGRMLPMNTFSSEILRKVAKSERIGQYNSDQFLISLLAMPDMWMRIPFIVSTNDELASFYGLSKDACAFIEVFDAEGQYRLQERLDQAYKKMPVERTTFDKDLMKLDEKVNILHQLFNHQMIHLFPKEDDANHTWYAPGDDLSGFAGKDSLFVAQIFPWYIGEVQAALRSGDWSKPEEILGMIETYQQAKNKTLDINPKRIAAEIKYNQLNVFQKTKLGYLILGGLLLVFSFVALFEQKKWLNRLRWILSLGIVIVFCFHIYGMGMRGFIAGYAPWSNSYETMVYVSWATVLAGFIFARRSALTFALATLFGGIILFVSGLNWMDPQINPLVPVLKSPWLMFHVAVIVGAYGFFGISCLIGLTDLVMMTFLKAKNKMLLASRIKELTMVNEMSLLIGLALMTIGTFLGAIWANESWGRYWGWDPKETWALITMIVYAITLHLRLIKKLNNAWLFNLMSVASFASVLMTFFGVNYFLSGMHAYGQTDGVDGIFVYLYIAAGIIALLGLLSYRKYKMNNPL
ncbi:cytochrome c biogenesis protein CcsA [Parabacteroides sp. PF5-6]|uniref:cytochrome c biogenesis protein CcsA n=1 Tax=Parabacteroides sp. PF5-6 TaxID=1742403 RepID=UPI0024051D78|nr:cytochrome c biogenesis protein CcsA [Parabacteroides sp. PF5-6]MDF9828786.1 cytochrome c-type biogenesis protein CcsB [Parabacteroides sp. PF5-6]